MALNADSLNPPNDDCSPERRRFDQKVAKILNSWLRREKTYLTSINEYALIADPSLTVRNVSGTTIVSNVGEIRFDQSDGFSVSEVSAGIARIDFTAPPVPPTLTVRESDNSVIVANVDDLAFNQATGFTVTDLTGGAAQVDLVFIPPNSVVPGTVDDSAFTESLAPVTKICQTVMHINGTVTIAAVDYPVTFTLSDTSNPYSVPLVAGVSYETTLITLIDGTTIDAPICHDAGLDCCPPCDCACEGYTTVGLGATTITDAPVTLRAFIRTGEYKLQWTLPYLFCRQNSTCDYTVTITSAGATYAGACVNPTFLGLHPQLTLSAEDFTGCASGASIDTDTQTGSCPTSFPTATVTIPAGGADCDAVLITVVMDVYADADDAAAVAGFVITVTEGPC